MSSNLYQLAKRVIIIHLGSSKSKDKEEASFLEAVMCRVHLTAQCANTFQIQMLSTIFLGNRSLKARIHQVRIHQLLRRNSWTKLRYLSRLIKKVKIV